MHPLTRMQCPRCIAAAGGKTTARTHSHAQMVAWGRQGGRPQKDQPQKTKIKQAPQTRQSRPLAFPSTAVHRFPAAMHNFSTENRFSVSLSS